MIGQEIDEIDVKTDKGSRCVTELIGGIGALRSHPHRLGRGRDGKKTAKAEESC
jgi:hypothetical protein